MASYPEVMGRWSKSIAIIALVAMIMTSLALAAAQPFPSAKPVPGCHEHGKQPSSHPPADYACCIAAHDSALVQAGIGEMAPPIAFAIVAEAGTVLAEQALQLSETFRTSSDPPRLVSLRV